LAPSPPDYQVRLLPLANPEGLKIKAGDKDAAETVLGPVSTYLSILKLQDNELTIISAAPHMHMLGTMIRVSLDSQTLVDIPAWDFHWQQSYFFQQPVVAAMNQSLFLECHYDNSAEH